MSLIFNGTTVTAATYNGTTLTNIIYNGTTVWSGAPSTIDVLVVAGGGGYHFTPLVYYSQACGGAGGLCYQTGRSISSGTTYTVTIGGGGGQEAPGSNSIFDTITALGGGMGCGGSGGSGGGGYWNDDWVYVPAGLATQRDSGGATGYGNAGGNEIGGNSAGGGGAGSAGGMGVDPGAGVGRSYDITGSSVEYARGGHFQETAGANSGWGSTGDVRPKPGSSGVVILRYPNTYPTATVTGSPTYTNVGGYHIYKFTGSGTIRW